MDFIFGNHNDNHLARFTFSGISLASCAAFVKVMLHDFRFYERNAMVEASESTTIGFASKVAKIVKHTYERYKVNLAIGGRFYLIRAAVMEVTDITIQFLKFLHVARKPRGPMQADIGYTVPFMVIFLMNNIIKSVLYVKRDASKLIVATSIFNVAFATSNVAGYSITEEHVHVLQLAAIAFPLIAVVHEMYEYSVYRRHLLLGKDQTMETFRRKDSPLRLTHLLIAGLAVFLMAVTAIFFAVQIVYTLTTHAHCVEKYGCKWKHAQPRLYGLFSNYGCNPSSIKYVDSSKCSQYTDTNYGEMVSVQKAIGFSVYPAPILRLFSGSTDAVRQSVWS